MKKGLNLYESERVSGLFVMTMNKLGEPGEMSILAKHFHTRMLADRHQQELAAERERVAQLQRFFGDMSHDLMSPLTILKTSLFMLGEAIAPELRQEYMPQLEAQMARLEKMLRDMHLMSLDIPTTHEFKLQQQDVNQMAARIVTAYQPLAVSKGQFLKLEGEADLPPVRFDKDMLGRALTNLVENALKYTPQGGQITVSTQMTKRDVLLQVRDTGCGIPAQDLPRIFERYYRVEAHKSSAEGTGLGLSIVLEIVKAHGGRIDAQSEPGQGSVFSIRLPLPATADEDIAPAALEERATQPA